MADPYSGVPRIALLGVCERAAFVREGHPAVWRYNLIGLRNTLVNYFYPCAARRWNLVLACYDPSTLQNAQIRLVDEDNIELVKLDVEFEQSGPGLANEGSRELRGWRLAPPEGPHWFLFHQPLDQVLIRRPGTVRVLCSGNGPGGEVNTGAIQCVTAAAPPLTSDRIAAIRADPNAAKHVRVALGCPSCPSKLKVIAGITKPEDVGTADKVWYQDVPDSWTCGCGETQMSLTSIRENLHGVLGKPLLSDPEDSELSFIRMYERSSLADICGEFGALLDDDPAEREVQQFLAENPVFLNRFSPTRIMVKAPVLTKYQTDFAILDPRGILTLIEIERPGTRLLKKDGDVCQKLQHAFDQVRNWLHLTTRRRSSVLECMGFEESDVAAVRGAVIAGRDKAYPSEHLMRLKGSNHGDIEFYSFDDLLEATVNLAREL